VTPAPVGPGDTPEAERVNEGAPAVIAAFEILDLLAATSRPAKMTEIAQGVALPKTSVFRLLRTLESIRAVRRDARDKRYRLGPKLDDYARISPTARLVHRFLDEAGPILRPLNETAQLGVLTGTDVTFVACIDSTKPVRLVSLVGRTLPAHASATGKAILAFAAPQQLQIVITAGLPALTERTITDPKILRTELEQIRRLGYATESEESTANLSCLAAPVWGDTAEVVGAITICIPRATLPSNNRFAELRQAVLDAARSISPQVPTGSSSAERRTPKRGVV
jgi:DNA-binding IclR family transcriptional regulator